MSDDFYDSREWLDLRHRVLKKAGGSCVLCGCRPSPGRELHADHIKPRSLHPELELVESNIQVLCRSCNKGKSNKDDTDWRYRASQELIDKLNRKTAVLENATPAQRAKLEQLSWLHRNDVDFSKEAGRQYVILWQEIEADWLAKADHK